MNDQEREEMRGAIVRLRRALGGCIQVLAAPESYSEEQRQMVYKEAVRCNISYARLVEGVPVPAWPEAQDDQSAAGGDAK